MLWIQNLNPMTDLRWRGTWPRKRRSWCRPRWRSSIPGIKIGSCNRDADILYVAAELISEMWFDDIWIVQILFGIYFWKQSVNEVFSDCEAKRWPPLTHAHMPNCPYFRDLRIIISKCEPKAAAKWRHSSDVMCQMSSTDVKLCQLFCEASF